MLNGQHAALVWRNFGHLGLEFGRDLKLASSSDVDEELEGWIE